jgi:heme/copper-type cytochrome/quinol oxidase subunit 2
MRGHLRETLGFFVAVVVAVPGLPSLAGLLGFWVLFFRTYDVTTSTAWNAALLVPRSQILQYGFMLVWPFVPLAAFFTGVILFFWTTTRHYRNHNSDEQRRKTWRLALILEFVGVITWWGNWSFTAILVVVPLVIVAVLVYVLWRASRDSSRDDENVGSPTYHTSLYVGLGTLYVGFFIIAFTAAPKVDAPLDYLVNSRKWEVMGRATGLSEDRWYYFTCEGNYASTPDEEDYRRFPPMTEAALAEATGLQEPREREPFLLRIYNPHVPEHYVDFCRLDGELLSLLDAN